MNDSQDPTEADNSGGMVGGSRAALAGLVFGVLYVVGFVVLGRIPDSDASEQAFESFYDSHRERMLVLVVGAYLLPIAGVALLWFTAAVRHRVVALAGRPCLLMPARDEPAEIRAAIAFFRDLAGIIEGLLPVVGDGPPTERESPGPS